MFFIKSKPKIYPCDSKETLERVVDSLFYDFVEKYALRTLKLQNPIFEFVPNVSDTIYYKEYSFTINHTIHGLVSVSSGYDMNEWRLVDFEDIQVSRYGISYNYSAFLYMKNM